MRQLLITIIVCQFLLTSATSAQNIDLAVLSEIDLEQPLGQLRAVPVNLGPGQPHAVAALYGSDAEIDPYIGMFFFPKSTLKLVLFDENGRIYWKRDLGPGVVPGIWFSPLYATDLDQDGVDELYLVGNEDPEHPLDHRKYVLEQRDLATGDVRQTRSWPQPKMANSMSHTYRHFIVGGQVDGKPVLVAVQGTYGPYTLHAYTAGLEPSWQLDFDPKKVGGSLGSHVTPVVDIDNDGADDLFIGEHCLSLRNGQELFCCDRQNWTGHSDIIQPILDRQKNRWSIWTCRETSNGQTPRLALFDDEGNRVWGDLEVGHMDTGWAAHLGSQGEPVVLGVRVNAKSRTAAGEHRTEVEEFTYRADTGKPVDLGFKAYTTIPVDLNGDAVHELVKGYFEGDGTVLDREGRTLGNVGGLTAICSKFTSRPGEQILSYDRSGKVRIWFDKNAVDSPAAMARYRSDFYRVNQKLTGVGYNLFTLGGL